MSISRLARPNRRSKRNWGRHMIADSDKSSAASLQQEQQRTLVRQWARGAWAEPCEAIAFRTKRFDLAKFSGRTELGTLPLWYRISWGFLLVILFPVWFVYGWIRQNLDDAGITKSSARKNGPGVISVTGSQRNPAPTSLIDTVKRAPRLLWLVVSPSKLAIVVASKDHSAPDVVWQTDEAATVRLQHAVQNSVQISWPDQSRAYFYPTLDERQILTRYVKSTWNDQR